MSLYADIQQDGDPKRINIRVEAYRSYLAAISRFLPESTRAFVLSDWYYSDPDKCPHDSWVESIEIFETFSGIRKEKREININVRLLGGSHKGNITFKYDRVSAYELRKPSSDGVRAFKHEDWLHDEVTLGGRGEVEHEIIFSSGAVWKIRCSSISYQYQDNLKPIGQTNR